jgi:hypothetical protein
MERQRKLIPSPFFWLKQFVRQSQIVGSRSENLAEKVFLFVAFNFKSHLLKPNWVSKYIYVSTQCNNTKGYDLFFLTKCLNLLLFFLWFRQIQF